MGWFDEQIRQRIENDDEMLADAFARMANLVSSEKIISSFAGNRQIAEEAIGDILKYYHVKAQEIPDQIKGINAVLEFLLRPSGSCGGLFVCRRAGTRMLWGRCSEAKRTEVSSPFCRAKCTDIIIRIIQRGK